MSVYVHAFHQMDHISKSYNIAQEKGGGVVFRSDVA